MKFSYKEAHYLYKAKNNKPNPSFTKVEEFRETLTHTYFYGGTECAIALLNYLHNVKSEKY